jgi:autotransporter-associated beta strand protein
MLSTLTWAGLPGTNWNSPHAWLGNEQRVSWGWDDTAVIPAGTTNIDIAGGTPMVAGITFQGNTPCTIGSAGESIGVDVSNLAVESDSASIAIGAAIQPQNGAGSGLLKTGSGTLVLSGGNTLGGPMTIAGGAVSIDSASELGTSQNLTFTGNGTLEVTGTNVQLTDTVQLCFGVTATIETANTVTLANTIGGWGNLALVGGGTLAFSTPNTFSGSTIITSGTVVVNNVNDLGCYQETEFNGTGTLDVTGSMSELSGPVEVDSGATGTISTSSAVQFDGYLTGGGTLVKAGPGSLSVGGPLVWNDFTGSLTVAGGTLQVFSNRALQYFVAGLTVDAGATLDLDGNGIWAGVLAGGGNIVNSSATAATLSTTNDTNTTFSGPISGHILLAKDGTGTLTLTGANSYAGGTSLRAGTLSVSGESNLGTGMIEFTGDATLQCTASTLLSDPISIDSGTDATVSPTGTRTIVDLHGAVTGGGNFVKAGSGTVYFASTYNSYEGSTTVDTGELLVTSLATFSNSAALTVATGATFQANAMTNPTVPSLYGGGKIYLESSMTVGCGDFEGQIAVVAGGWPTPGLIKTSIDGAPSDTLTLGGMDGFTGPTSVQGGTLCVTGRYTGSPITVVNGTLSGTGTVGSVTVSDGGTVWPGVQAPGIPTGMTIGSLAYAPGSITNFNVDTFDDDTNQAVVTSSTTLGTPTGQSGVSLNISPNASFPPAPRWPKPSC